MLKNLKSIGVDICAKYIKVNASNKNGPKGTKFFFLFHNIINEIGNAITLAIKITNNPKKGLSTKPTTNISFISPPPRLSFLNRKFPINITKYINPNKSNPDNIEESAATTPLLIAVTIMKYPEKKINTSSGII